MLDFALHRQPEDKLMNAISRAWYNSSYTMAAKPIKTLELHYTMIQFLIKYNITQFQTNLESQLRNPTSFSNFLRRWQPEMIGGSLANDMIICITVKFQSKL